MPIELQLFHSMQSVEGPWRTLEADGYLTPYQRFDFLRAYLATVPDERRAIAAVGFFVGQRPIALLPLAITRRFGVATAQLVGAELGGSGCLIMGRGADARVSDALLHRAFDLVRREIGRLDLVNLKNLPPTWLERQNPLLVLPHWRASDDLYSLAIDEGTFARRIRAKRRANIERGRRRLKELFGPLAFRRAATSAELAAIHEAFLSQRGQRFARMGIDNVFAREEVVSFFLEASRQSFGAERPALCFHALYAGEEIVATACGTFCGSHYSMYINSTAPGRAARYSLTAILMQELMRELIACGVTSIDMGVGDFPYKLEWTNPVPLFDSVVGLSPLGHMLAPFIMARGMAKRLIKRNDRLWSIVSQIRLARHRLHLLGERLWERFGQRAASAIAWCSLFDHAVQVL
ncbi:Acetyltransf_6 domain-containing protein [Hyphomicrobiales bacterium]|nr:Acetyltransf_6 domain-containing protein [Hyphomicrobiales bacterium]CAH1666016.1 GNAT family N-acetyltransferase [Hyphomicrobiales bacterium]